MKKKICEPTPYELAVKDFLEATKELQRARINFNNATSEYFEIANDELTTAQAKVDICHKKVKALHC